jgi:SAM-dependent methyltransferase
MASGSLFTPEFKQSGAMMLSRFANNLRRSWARFNDALLNISTVDQSNTHDLKAGWWKGPTTEKSRFRDNHKYASPDYHYIRKTVKILNAASEDVVFDIGCGKGRVLCLFAREPVKKCVGVELMEDLCHEARANAVRMRGRRSPVEIFCQDAAQANLAEGTIYYLFNPFGAETLDAVLQNIRRSLSEFPRRVRIVYHNSVHKAVLDSCEWVREFHCFKTVSGTPVHFYESVASIRGASSSPRIDRGL